MTDAWPAERHARRALAIAAVTLAIQNGILMAFAPWWLALYVLFYGMAQGSTGIVHSARAADVFAGASFGSIYGWLALAVGPGEALGAWLGGTMYDVWGSYLPAFGVVVLSLAAGVVSMWRVRVPASETRDSGAAST